tara:strand:- start:902 stop:2539 length:1638 start_codon:yes stop_codon:yes gene_type:complete
MINICFCSDKNLTNYIPVVINSILEKNKENNINIHYIHNITDNTILEDLENYINKFNNLKLFKYYKTWDYNYNGLIHITSATMLRLFIPELINEKKIIYLDLDLIVNIDLLKLYNIECNYTGLALKESIGCADNNINNNPTIININNKKSGNCGVIVMDLDILKKNNFTNKCLEISKQYPTTHDQFIINTYCECDYTRLPQNYNIFFNDKNNCKLIDSNDDYIFHFVGKLKPYNTNIGEYQYLWDRNKGINFGILTYKNVYSKNESKNIGDYIQSLAAINIYRKIIEKYNNIKYDDFHMFLNLVLSNNIPNFNFVFINRDNININSDYKYNNIITIFNGWFMHPCDSNNNFDLNIPSNIIPVFISVHINKLELLKPKYLEIFKKFEPIGCRDLSTLNNLQQKNIKCYFSGCLTLTIDFYKWNNINNNIYIVDANRKRFNKSMYTKISHSDTTIITKSFKNIFNDTLKLLKKYSECNRIVTTRLHCYLPCKAMNIPVILLKNVNYKKENKFCRFTGLVDLDTKSYDKIKINILNDTISRIENIINA